MIFYILIIREVLKMINMRLDEKVAIVTGAGKGIGRDIALTLADAGAKVAIISRTESDLKSLAKEIDSLGSQALVIPLDVGNVNEIYQGVEKTLNHFSKIDILVNSAGFEIFEKVIDVSEKNWYQTIETNLKGSFFMCQAVAKKSMITQKSGKIINISSQLAFVGNYDRSVYCSSKGGVSAMTRAMAIEWSDYNINVNEVAPGYTKTEMIKEILEDEKKYQKAISLIPLRKFAEPREVSVTVLYLASDYSNFVTGTSILIDGGYTAR